MKIFVNNKGRWNGLEALSWVWWLNFHVDALWLIRTPQVSLSDSQLNLLVECVFCVCVCASARVLFRITNVSAVVSVPPRRSRPCRQTIWSLWVTVVVWTAFPLLRNKTRLWLHCVDVTSPSVHPCRNVVLRESCCKRKTVGTGKKKFEYLHSIIHLEVSSREQREPLGHNRRRQKCLIVETEG